MTEVMERRGVDSTNIYRLKSAGSDEQLDARERKDLRVTLISSLDSWANGQAMSL